MAIALVLTILVLQAADGWTTYRVITRGLGHERNRIVRWLMDRVGVYWALVLLKGWAAVFIAAGLVLGWWRGDLAGLALLVLAVFYTWLVINNFKVLRGE